MSFKYKIILLMLSFIYSSDSFIIKERYSDSTTIGFNMGDIIIDNNEEYHTISFNGHGKTQNIGEPELPTFTFNYSIESDKEYEVQMIINDYEMYENINISPTQPLYKQEDNIIFVKNDIIYNSLSTYPESNINTKRMSLRGYELLNIEIIPFEYNFSTKKLKAYNNIDIIISESGFRSNTSRAPRSRMFEEIYKNQIINSDDYQDSRSFQKPSILYICGGSIASTSYMDELSVWRHKQGYVVNVASLSETGSSTTSIKNYILDAYNNWENPPEHVCLIGDANGSVYVPTYTVYGGSGWSSASGEGDFPYTLLEGDDLLPELTIGRISIRSTSEFVTSLNKIIGYEKNYANDTDWLSAMALVGDPYDSGISTVITNEYIEQIANIHGGITDIRTKYSGSNFDDWMRDEINDGVVYLNYRGFYGFSQFTSNDVNQLNNGYKLPFLATLTCGTGNFATETTCMTESLFRAGTSVSPKGAVAVIGTAQSYTHTAFNNIVDMGIFEGIFINEAKTVGEAVVYGKLAMNEIYPQNPNDNVYLFSTWNNLLGDPALQLWTSSPSTMIVQHDQLLINGSNNFKVTIKDTDNNPIENIIVTLVKMNNDNDEIFLTSITNLNGIADFILEDYSEGIVYVTSRAQNFIPEETSFVISEDLPEVVLLDNSVIIDDSNEGNDDEIWNPGETVDISFIIKNESSSQIDNLNIEVSSFSNYIDLNNTVFSIGDLLANNEININGIIGFAHHNMSNSEDPYLRVKLYSSDDDFLWNYILPINYQSGEIYHTNISIISDQNNNGMLDRGESAYVEIELSNIGSININNLTALISSPNPQLSFEENVYYFNEDIAPNQVVTSTNSINFIASSDIINGTVVNLSLDFTSSNDFEAQKVVPIQIGNVQIGDPVGPDTYGYYIYDMNDDEYTHAPDYNWIEIDPDLGGDGYEVNINDNGDDGDDVTTISFPLNFDFTFYGVTYEGVSICSNGWISFGQTNMESFRNYTLPGPGGPSPMIAVFWDDLKTTSGGEVYQYYDEINNAFIIEWSKVRTFLNNTEESFQVILYDTGSETPTGDDEIKLQYKEFNNNSVGNYPVGNYSGAVIHGQYCTIGIENHLSNDGLQYTFNNTYPAAAMQLYDQTALFITTRGSTILAQPSVDYNLEEFIFNTPINEQESQEFIISNNGETGSTLIYDLNISPFASNVEEIDDFGYAWTKSANNDFFNYEWIDISSENETLSFETNDSSTLIDLNFEFPFYENNYNQCLINPNGWIGFEDDNTSWNNQSIFNDESPRSAIFGFWDDLNPSNSGNEVGQGYVKYHSNSDRLVVWYEDVVHWTSLDRVYDFQIIIYSNGAININYESMQGGVDSATIGIINSNGTSGLEVAYNENFIQDELSIAFDSAPDWVSLNLLSGNENEIFSGTSTNYDVIINTNFLNIGTYVAYLVVNTNISNESDIFPINLNAEQEFILGDVNQDGVINVTDIIRIVTIIMGEYIANNLELSLADFNDDGVLNVTDIIALVNYILSS